MKSNQHFEFAIRLGSVHRSFWSRNGKSAINLKRGGFSGRLFPCIRLLSIMANSGSWKRMKRVFFPWGKKNRNQPPPPPPPSFDELTSSPGIQCFSFNFNKTRCSILLLGFSVSVLLTLHNLTRGPNLLVWKTSGQPFKRDL